MKRIAQLLFAALVVACCSATNTDVCLNPYNPAYNNIIQFKQVDVTTTYIELPYGRDFNISSNHNCYVFEWDDLDIFQRTSTLFDDHFFAKLTGVLYDNCDNQKKRYELEVYQRSSQSLVEIQSHKIESATIGALELRGNLRCNGQNYNVQVTTYSTQLYSDCEPTYFKQDDDYYTENNSQCTLRVRSDTAENIVYSQPFGFKITLWNNIQLHFTFPTHKRAEVEYCYDKYFYQNCNCRQIVGCGGDVEARTRAAPTLRAAVPAMPAMTDV
jgi:hypothetical protein